MELVTLILTVSLLFGLIVFFIRQSDWKLLLTIVPIVMLIPFTLQLDSDQTITYGVDNLGCGQTSNTTFNCQYFTGLTTIQLDPHLMTIFNYTIFLGILMLLGFVISECFYMAKRK